MNMIISDVKKKSEKKQKRKMESRMIFDLKPDEKKTIKIWRQRISSRGNCKVKTPGWGPRVLGY